MGFRYRYGHSGVRRQHVLLAVGITCLLVVIGGLIFVLGDTSQNKSQSVEGQTRVIGQVVGNDSKKKTIDEPLFALELPSDWKEQSRRNLPTENSITWQATKKNQDNRWLTIYVDIIPTTKSVNRLQPVSAQGNTLALGDLSDNCITFTEGGSFNSDKAAQAKDKPARWGGVDFICNLPSVVDNQIGTGSPEGINQVTLTGSKGKHKYFFLFTDHNIQPDYSIFTEALQSFHAK